MSGPTFEKEPLIRFRDNPLMLAMIRLHLRKNDRRNLSTVTGITALCAAAMGLVIDKESYWNAVMYVGWAIVGMVLLLRGASTQVGLMLQERQSGILDFHRAAPVTAETHLLGYLVGGVAREYQVSLIAVPFLFLFAFLGDAGVLASVLMLLSMLTCALLYHTFSLLLGLCGKSQRRSSGAALLLIFMLLTVATPLHMGGLSLPVYLTPWVAFSLLFPEGGEDSKIQMLVNVFGIPVSPVLFSFLAQLTLLVLLFRAAARRLQREQAPIFSRTGSLGFLAVVLVLILAASWGPMSRVEHSGGSDLPARVSALSAAYLFGATLIAGLLLIHLVPTYLEFVRAHRRAQRWGRTLPAALDDGALAGWLAPAHGAIVLAGFPLLLQAVQGLAWDELLSAPVLAGLAAMFSFLSFLVSATQYVRLAPKSAGRSPLLTIFLTCVLPFLVASIVLAADGEQVAPYIAGLSPLMAPLGGYFLLALTLGRDSTSEVPLLSVLVSLVISGGLVAWFTMQVRALRTRIVQQTPQVLAQAGETPAQEPTSPRKEG